MKLPASTKVHDITRVDEPLSRDDLIAAVEARDTLLAVAAHELRNAMTPIIGQIELLLDSVRTGRCPLQQVEQRLERVQHTVRRYVKRAGTLLDVSRMTSGKFQLRLEPLDLVALLHEVVREFAPDAQRNHVPITLQAPETLFGIWDHTALEQIVDNLVSNALKYGDRTPVELSATLRGEQVCLQVRDHGDGISVDNRERIFGRFERAVGRRDRGSGFGVGLWVVRQLAEAMDGTIIVEDAPGGGALFTVTLPQHVKGKPV